MALIKVKRDVPFVEGISTENHPALQAPTDLQDVVDFDTAANGTFAKRAGFAVDYTDSRGNAISNPSCLMGADGRALLIASGPTTPTGADTYSTLPYVYEVQSSVSGSNWQKKEIAAHAMLEEEQVYSITNSDITNLDSAVMGRLQCVVVDKSPWAINYITVNQPLSGAVPEPSTGLEARIIDLDTKAVVASFSFDSATTTNTAWCPRVIATESQFIIFYCNNNNISFVKWSPASNAWSSHVLEGSPTGTAVAGDVAGREMYDVVVDSATNVIYFAHINAALNSYRLMRFVNVAALSTGASHTVNTGIAANSFGLSLGMTLNNVVVVFHSAALGYSAQYTKSALAVAVANRNIFFPTGVDTFACVADISTSTACLIAWTTYAADYSLDELILTEFMVDNESGAVTAVPFVTEGAVATRFSGCMSKYSSSFPQVTFIALQKKYRDTRQSVSGMVIPPEMDFQPRYTVLECGYSPALTPEFFIKPVGVVRDGVGKRFIQATGSNAIGMFGAYTQQRARVPAWSWVTRGLQGSLVSPSFAKAGLTPGSVYAVEAITALPGNPSNNLHQSDVATISVSPINAALGRCEKAGEALLMNGGGTTASSDTLPESGFFSIPAICAGGFTPVAPASAITAGVYKTIVVYSWRDEAGNLYRSTPSLPATYTYAAGNVPGYAVVQSLISRRGVDMTRRYPGGSYAPTLEVYQTDTNGSTYYLSQQFPCSGVVYPPVNDILFSAVPPWKGVYATYEPQGEVLYTTGGVLENGVAPNSIDVANFNQRAWSLGSGNVLRFSKLLRANRGVEWPEEFALQLSHKGGRAFAIRTHADRLIIFKQNQIEVLSGSGPADDGSGQQYSEPDVLKEGIGCVNPLSITSCPEGLVFEGSKGFSLITGDLSVVPIGSKSRAFTESSYYSGRYCGALHFPERQEVHFCSMIDTLGVVRWNYRKQRWSRLTVGGFTASHLARDQSKVLMITPGSDPYTTTTGSRGSGLVWRERSSSYSDLTGFGEQSYTPSITTGWIKMEGLLACQRVYDMLVMTQKCVTGANWPSGTGAKMVVTFAYKAGTGTGGADLPSNTITFNIGSDGVLTKEMLKVPLPKQKMAALQVTISFIASALPDTVGVGTLIALAFNLGIRPGMGDKFGIVSARNIANTN